MKKLRWSGSRGAAFGVSVAYGAWTFHISRERTSKQMTRLKAFLLYALVLKTKMGKNLLPATPFRIFAHLGPSLGGTCGVAIWHGGQARAATAGR